MNKLGKMIFAACMLITASSTLVAQQPNGTVLCALIEVKECAAGEPCIEVTPESVALPDFIAIDLANKLISSVGVTPVATTRIEREEHLQQKLILQGGDITGDNPRGGVGWTMNLDKADGKLVASGVGDGFALVIFGNCIKP